MTPAPAATAEFERPPDYRHEIAARGDRVRFLLVPERRYLMIEGTAAPGTQGFQDAFGALYPVAYTLHFALRRRDVDAPVGALEGLYWVDEPRPIDAARFADGPAERGPWSWRLLLPVPDAASDAEVTAAFAEVERRRKPALIDRLRCEAWEEGPAAQIMHVGPYDAEPVTIQRLHGAIAERGLRPRGCHHEIYISDPNRTAPERLKTVLRQPVEPIER